MGANSAGKNACERFDVDGLIKYMTDAEFLLTIKGIGPEIIQSIGAWFSREENVALLHRMTAA